MKKNRMMRLASGLLVAVLATTSMISGTYAKYVTSASASDAARVAKWGVNVVAEGALFATAYDKDINTPHTESNVITVESHNSSAAGEKSVVAPGTKNETGITFSITGTPEVAVRLDVAVTNGDETGDQTDVYLNAGTYPDLTTGKSVATVDGDTTVTDDANDDTDVFTFSGDPYYPIVYTLSQKKSTETEFKPVASGNLETIAEYLEDLTTDEGELLAPNTILDKEYGTYKLTWEWVYPAGNVLETDQKDTLLGSLAANDAEAIAAVASGYNLKADVKIAISVTQVD